MPKKGQTTVNFSQSLDYDYTDDDDDDNNIEEDISDNNYELEKDNKINQTLPSLSQILIVSFLLEKREFILSRNSTKKFHNKIHQYQKLSQTEKLDYANYDSRIGKVAAIVCKLAAISEILRRSIEILK